jgi:hypothetical protein
LTYESVLTQALRFDMLLPVRRTLTFSVSAEKAPVAQAKIRRYAKSASERLS